MPDAGPYDVLIADKNPLVLSALKDLLDHDERFETVVSATDGERFLEAAARMHFDVGVIGWVMPFVSGQQVLERLQDRQDAPRVIVYTGDETPGLATTILRLGGAGLCAKSESPERVVDVIVQVAEGKMIFPFVDGRALIAAGPLDLLTSRELEVLEGLSSGASNAELAAAQCVSPNTVKFHLSNIYQKLGVTSRAAAVAFYLANR